MPVGLPLVSNFVEQPVAQLVEKLDDRHAVFARERALTGAARGGSGDEPTDIGLVTANDGGEEVDRAGLVAGRYHALREVDVRDRAFEAASGGGDIAVVLPSNEHADARCDVVRYVAIGEVERHAGFAEEWRSGGFFRGKTCLTWHVTC